MPALTARNLEPLQISFEAVGNMVKGFLRVCCLLFFLLPFKLWVINVVDSHIHSAWNLMPVSPYRWTKSCHWWWTPRGPRSPWLLLINQIRVLGLNFQVSKRWTNYEQWLKVFWIHRQRKVTPNLRITSHHLVFINGPVCTYMCGCLSRWMVV